MGCWGVVWKDGFPAYCGRRAVKARICLKGASLYKVSSNHIWSVYTCSKWPHNKTCNFLYSFSSKALYKEWEKWTWEKSSNKVYISILAHLTNNCVKWARVSDCFGKLQKLSDAARPISTSGTRAENLRRSNTRLAAALWIIWGLDLSPISLNFCQFLTSFPSIISSLVGADAKPLFDSVTSSVQCVLVHFCARRRCTCVRTINGIHQMGAQSFPSVFVVMKRDECWIYKLRRKEESEAV